MRTYVLLYFDIILHDVIFYVYTLLSTIYLHDIIIITLHHCHGIHNDIVIFFIIIIHNNVSACYILCITKRLRIKIIRM